MFMRMKETLNKRANECRLERDMTREIARAHNKPTTSSRREAQWYSAWHCPYGQVRRSRGCPGVVKECREHKVGYGSDACLHTSKPCLRRPWRFFIYIVVRSRVENHQIVCMLHVCSYPVPASQHPRSGRKVSVRFEQPSLLVRIIRVRSSPIYAFHSSCAHTHVRIHIRQEERRFRNGTNAADGWMQTGDKYTYGLC